MIKPAGHRLVIKAPKQIEVDEITKHHLEFLSTLEIVGTETRGDASVDEGVVVSIGPTAFDDFGGDKWCKVGDEIIFAKFAGKMVKDKETEEEFFIINDADVVAIIKEA